MAPGQPSAIDYRHPNPVAKNVVCEWVHSIILVAKVSSSSSPPALHYQYFPGGGSSGPPHARRRHCRPTWAGSPNFQFLFTGQPHLIPPFNVLGPGGQHAHLFQIGNAPSQIAPWEECGWLATLPWPCRLSILSQGCVPISSDGLHPDRPFYALSKPYQPWPCPIILTHNFYSPQSPSGV